MSLNVIKFFRFLLKFLSTLALSVSIAPSFALASDVATLSFGSSDGYLLQPVVPGSNFAESSISLNGWWISVWLYRPSDNSHGAAVALSNKSTDNKYLYIGVNSDGFAEVTFRNTSIRTVSSAKKLSPGWNLITFQIKRNSKNKFRLDMDVVANDQLPMRFTGGGKNETEISEFTSLTIGAAVRKRGLIAPSDFAISNVAWGTGNPLGMHRFVFGNGINRSEISDYDYRSDRNASLNGTWRFTHATPGSIVSTEHLTQFVDQVSHLDTWTLVGDSKWLDYKAPFLSNGATASHDHMRIDEGKNQTIVINVSMENVDWKNPVVDEKRIKLWAENFGFGKIGIINSSIIPAGHNRVSVLLQLDRPVYAGEVVTYRLGRKWIVDSNGSTSIAGSGTVFNNSSELAPKFGTRISHGKAYLELERPLGLGHYLDGIPFIVIPDGSTALVDFGPSEALKNGKTIGGAEKNPLRRSTATGAHGYDEREKGYSAMFKIDPLNSSFKANDSLVKQIPNLNPKTKLGGNKYHAVMTQQWTGFHFVASRPDPREIAPSLVGYDGSKSRDKARLDLDKIKASLPQLPSKSFSKEVPARRDLESRFTKPNWISQFDSVETARRMGVGRFTARDSYGQDIASTTNAVAAYLLLDSSTSDELENLIIWTAHHGIQWYWPIANSPLKLEADGAQSVGRLFSIVAALYWTGHEERIGSLEKDVGTNELEQTFLITQTEIDAQRPHAENDNRSKLYLYAKEKEISAVDGLEVTIGKMNKNETFRIAYVGLLLKRKSDGKTANIVRFDSKRKTFTIDRHPMPPLRVGEIVYGVSLHASEIGEPSWGIRHARQPSWNEPTIKAPYRNLNLYAGQVIAIKALGLMHPNFAGLEEYVEAVNTGRFPAPDYVFPHMHDSYFEDFGTGDKKDISKSLWDAHWQKGGHIDRTKSILSTQ